MRLIAVLAVAALALVVLVAACNGGDAAAPAGEGEKRLEVVTSLPLFADFLRQVGGDRLEVTAVIPTGADPETFEPKPKDIREVTQADVVFINGRGLESAFEDAIVNNVPKGTLLVRFGDLFEGENPHFWLSVDNALTYAQQIQEALKEADPDNAALYQENLKAYDQELASLAQGLKEAVSSIPPERRKLVTTHDAFPYFADYLGLELVGFVTPTEAQEPSPADIRELVSAIREEKVPAIFAEPGFTDKTLRQVAAEADVQICVLYSDALDDRATTYIEMMRFNAAELARCLGGGAGG